MCSTRYDAEEILSDAIRLLPRFGTTLESEFAVNWKEEKIMFYGKYFWKYTIFDHDGDPVQDHSPDAECASMTIEWIDGSGERQGLDVGLEDSAYLNGDKVRMWLFQAKGEVLASGDQEFIRGYWADYSRMHEWNMKAARHVAALHRKLEEYAGAAMEPDMNVLAEYRREILAEMERFDAEFRTHFKC